MQRTATQSACARILADANTVEDAAAPFLSVLGVALGWEIGVLWTVTPDGRRLRCAGLWHSDGSATAEFVAVTRDLSLDAGVGLPGRVWATGTPAWITDVESDPDVSRSAVAARAGLRAWFGFPLTIHGRSLGVIEFLTRRAQAPDDDLLQWMTGIGQQMAQFIERHRVEASARTTQATHAAIIATALDCIVTIDREGRIVEFNAAAEETFGYTKPEVVGRLMADVVIPESQRARHRAGFEHYLATGEGPLLGRRIETTALHASGREFPVELTITELPTEGSSRFAGFIRDISGREEARRGSEEAQQRAAFLAEAGVILGRSLDYETTFANMVRLAVPTFADWCAAHVVQDDGSIRCVALVHRDPQITATVWPRVRDYHFDSDAPEGGPRVIRSGRPAFYPHVPADMLSRMARDAEDLRTRELLGLGSVIAVPLIASGRVLGAIAFVMSQSGRHYEARDLAFAEDLASRAALAVDNALLYRNVQAANQLKDEFLATLSHELRTPLNSILGWARMLASGQIGDSQREHALHVIERSARSQKAIIEDLLDMSRITAGRFALQRRADDVARTIQAALDTIRPAAEAKHITLDACIAPEARGLMLVADHERLQQIFWNLLANAVKFTPRDGRVTIAAAVDAGDMIVTVSDTGEGIEAAVLPHVFERFRQADSSSRRRHGGLGLGLAIVRQLTELHGGTVEATSAGRGHGATFSVRLPLGESAPAASTGSADGVAVGRGQLGGLTILFVEDDRDTRELFSLAMEADGATVQTASSASEALALMATRQPAMVVADIGLAGDDGYDLIRKIRSLPNGDHGRLVAVAFSAYTTRQHQEMATAAGFDLFVGKPIAPPEFVAAIARVIDTRR